MREVAFLVYPDYSMMALSVVMAFEVANSVAKGSTYELHFVSEAGGQVRTSCGMVLDNEPFTQMPFHTLVVGGALTPKASTPGLIAYM